MPISVYYRPSAGGRALPQGLTLPRIWIPFRLFNGVSPVPHSPAASPFPLSDSSRKPEAESAISTNGFELNGHGKELIPFSVNELIKLYFN